MPDAPVTGGRGLPRWRVGLAVVLVVQLLVLYLPRAPSVGPVTWTDKVVHLLVFATPAALILLSRLRPWWLVVLALHAPLSEVLQHFLLPNRSGDPWDAVADVTGVVLGALVVVVGRRRHRW